VAKAVGIFEHGRELFREATLLIRSQAQPRQKCDVPDFLEGERHGEQIIADGFAPVIRRVYC